jgi:pimeloyl-ACP methyl ester carboxylesterase
MKHTIGTLYVEEYGEGPQHIVFLHGLGGTSRYWQAGTAAFNQSGIFARCHMVDLLGFGRSPKPWCRYTLDRHVGALESILQQYSNVVLVGHSLGAALALAYAARHPGSVKKLVLISLPYFDDQANAYRWLRRRPSGWLYTNMITTALGCIFTRRIVGNFLPLVITSVPKEVVQDLVKHTFLSSTSSLWNVLYRYDLNKEAAALSSDIRVTCIHAHDDDTAPFSGTKGIVERFPSWELIALKHGGHHLWFSQTETCWKAIADDSNYSDRDINSKPCYLPVKNTTCVED